MIPLPSGSYDPEMRRVHGPCGWRYLPPAMHAILMLLVRANGRPVRHETITATLWPMPCDEPDGPELCVRVQVCALRRRLAECGADARALRTMHRVGYYLEA